MRSAPGTPTPATRGATALLPDDTIGSLAPGYEADLVVLDMKSTPLIEY
jgi:guanine deaminase